MWRGRLGVSFYEGLPAEVVALVEINGYEVGRPRYDYQVFLLPVEVIVKIQEIMQVEVRALSA